MNLIAYIRAEMGLGQAGRGLAAALQASATPFSIFNLERGIPASHTDFSWSGKEVTKPGFDITISSVNPDQSYSLKMYAPASALAHCYLIGNWFWELPRLPAGWVRELSFYNEIWAPSRFIQDCILRDATVPVVHIPPVVQVDVGKPLPRSHFGLSGRNFVFLAMADTRSAFERKNPLGAIRAFKTAFGPADQDVSLVLKLNNPDYGQANIRALQAEAKDWPNIIILSRVMSRSEVNALIATCDCFVSLHRAEGFGLGPAEAMCLGRPAIMTNWSGNVDYMTTENSAAIDYKLVPVGKDTGIYTADQYWAEPSVEHAAIWMSKLAADRAAAIRMGKHAQQTISAKHSPESVGALISQRLAAIRRGA